MEPNPNNPYFVYSVHPERNVKVAEAPDLFSARVIADAIADNRYEHYIYNAEADRVVWRSNQVTHDELIAALDAYIEAYTAFQAAETDDDLDIGEYSALGNCMTECHDYLCELWAKYREAKSK